MDGEVVEMEGKGDIVEDGEGHEAEGMAGRGRGSSRRDPKKRIFST